MTTIIIEDEKPAARLLQRKLAKLDIKVVAMLHSVQEAVEYFRINKHPDLIFLDVQLSDGLSFEIFEKVSINSSVIFTTAYDEYALKAFKLNSIDYLLKPIDEEELEFALNKFKTLQKQVAANSESNQINIEQIRKLLTITDTKVARKRFTVRVGHTLKVINIEEVECFFSENKGTYLHTYDNRNYLVEETLEVLEKELEPKKFFRINRKFILPLQAIKEIQMYTNSRLKILLPSYKDDEVIVSREKVQDFKNWLD